MYTPRSQGPTGGAEAVNSDKNTISLEHPVDPRRDPEDRAKLLQTSHIPPNNQAKKREKETSKGISSVSLVL